MRRQPSWVGWAAVAGVIFTLLAAGTTLYINVRKIQTKNYN